MELDDPDLPPHARTWALAGADHIDNWLDRVKNREAGDPVVAFTDTMLTIVEEQARIIAEIALRIDAFNDPRQPDK